MPAIRRVHTVDEAMAGALADVTKDCVDGGASIGFMQPFPRERGIAFWKNVGADVAAGRRALLVAEDEQGICGTVQLIFDLPENQPHRADVAKMQVHRRVRRHGVGAALLGAAEQAARECGKYERLGWVRVGDIPEYALFPEGGYCSTTVFYRRL
jgi:GNAT superfamily N-acetyltransferase